MADNKHPISSGVQELIARLRNEGVQAGRHKAEQIIEEAQKQAADIVAQAREEADRILKQAHAEIQAERAATHEALQLAMRDIVLELKEQLTRRFEQTVRGLVTAELKDREFLRRMILAISGHMTPDETHHQALELLLSHELFPEENDSDASLQAFIRSITSVAVQKGIELKPSGRIKSGIILRLVGKDMEFDLTDEAISALLLKHLLPRYRAYIEGER